MEPSYPWYHIVQTDDALMQGDLIEDCPIVIPPTTIPDDGNVEIEIQTYDVLVLTQSCDLENNKIKFVLVCPYFNIMEFCNNHPSYNDDKLKNQMRKGDLPGYHLLNKYDGTETGFHAEYLVADFRNVFGVSFSFLKEFAKGKPQRLRLLSPYREHLSQALARYFMRVGLPSNIPEFKKTK